MTLLQLINLHGYGRYVWPAYGLVAVFLAWHWFMPWKQWRKLKKTQRTEHAQTQ